MRYGLKSHLPIFRTVFLGVIIASLIFILFLLTQNNSAPVPGEEEVNNQLTTSLLTQNLHVPWSMVFLPSGELVVTERKGTLQILASEPVTIPVPGVVERGEGGLLGIALHPRFSSNKFVYLYFTGEQDGKTVNKVVRYVLNGTTLTEEKVILDTIPGGGNHNGGYLAFGPDGFLYITVGDAGLGSLAQDTSSLAGKILRVKDDGTVPADNPFNNEVYSYGHRNPQGLAWDDKDRLWATEHGRSGVQSGLDEINRIQKGGNYGWPVIEGDETREGMLSPALHSGANTTWAPASIVFKNNALYFTGLRGQSLYRVEVESDGTLGELTAHFVGEFGRLRSLALGPNGNLYLGTSNQDGRGRPKDGDDRILTVIE